MNKEEKRIYRQNYRIKNKEILSQKNKEYYSRPEVAERTKSYQQNYRKEHLEERREKARIQSREYYQRYKLRCSSLRKNRRKDYFLSWEEIIPKITNCGICGIEIHFKPTSGNPSIHFDHRNDGKEIIKGDPNSWIASHRCNERNKKIWLDCNFGMLCRKCNVSLPTLNRTQWLENVTKYITR